MSCSSIMFSLFLMSPCSEGGGEDVNAAVQAAVSNPQRTTEDVANDANRKPAKVLSFFNIQPGMTVLELFSGAGYYTEILNSLVGGQGQVISHNNQAYLSYVGDAYEARQANGGLTQVQTTIAELNDLELASNSLDAAVLVLTWHDFLFADPDQGWHSIDQDLLMNKLCTGLKPGGVVGLVDHVADSGGDVATVAKGLHRVDPEIVKQSFADSCFTLEAEAKFLRNKDDDHSLSVFDPAIRGKTDRFVFRFVKQ